MLGNLNSYCPNFTRIFGTLSHLSRFGQKQLMASDKKDSVHVSRGILDDFYGLKHPFEMILTLLFGETGICTSVFGNG